MANDEQTAIHEAGHAVVGRALGLVCGEVSIDPDTPDDLGYSVIGDPRFSWGRGDGPKRAACDAFCIALYAGAEAERLILGTVDVGDGTDRDRAVSCMTWAGVRDAAFVGDDAYDRNEVRLRARARIEVFRQRGAIERVAAALLEKRRLSGSDVQVIG